jgi:hypothetical protein
VQGYYYSKPKPLSEVAAMLDPAPAQLPLVSAEDQAAAATQPAIGSRIGDLVE